MARKGRRGNDSLPNIYWQEMEGSPGRYVAQVKGVQDPTYFLQGEDYEPFEVTFDLVIGTRQIGEEISYQASITITPGDVIPSAKPVTRFARAQRTLAGAKTLARTKLTRFIYGRFGLTINRTKAPVAGFSSTPSGDSGK